MPPELVSEEHRAVWEALEGINAAWLHGNVDKLPQLLHERMVIVPPGFAERITGRAACAAGYEDFARDATVESFTETEANVDVFASTAVVSYRYDLTYEMGGASYRDTGRDLYVFTHEDGRWQAVWRILTAETGDA